MPFTPTAPASTQKPTTPTTVVQDVDTYHITYFSIHQAVGSTATLKVRWEEGYDDGGFVPVNRKKAEISGASLDAEIAIMCSASNSRYGEIKTAIYALLVTDGHIPAGSVS